MVDRFYIDDISKIDEDEDKLFKLNIASTVLDIGYEVAMGFLDVSTGASIAVSYLIGTPGSILQACFPVDEWIATKKDVIDYLRILQAAVETSQYTDDRETVKITVSYIFSETYTPHMCISTCLNNIVYVTFVTCAYTESVEIDNILDMYLDEQKILEKAIQFRENILNEYNIISETTYGTIK